MFASIFQTKTPLFLDEKARTYDPPEAVAILKPNPAAAEDEDELTCLTLVRRKNGENVSMRLLLRHHAAE